MSLTGIDNERVKLIMVGGKGGVGEDDLRRRHLP